MVVTVLFAGFPSAFAAVATALHVPILVLLLGVVLRGAAFSFRAHDPDEASRRRWGAVFSAGSIIAPIASGVIVGALTSGQIRFEGDGAPVGGFFRPWISTWTLLVGAFALTAFSWLAAVYLCVEAAARKSDAVRAFHSRALVSFGALTLLAWMLLASSKEHAPAVWTALVERRAAWAIHGVTAAASVIAIDGIIRERYRRARLFAALQVSTIVLGWASAQAPCIIVPSVTVQSAASPPRTIALLAGALVAGSVVLLPSLAFLYKSFKGELPLWPFEPKR